MPRGTEDDQPHWVDAHVGRRIAEERIKRGMNQSQLGKKLDVSFQQVQKYEKGANRVSASKLFLIAETFQISVHDLFPPTGTRPDPDVQTAAEMPVSRFGIRLTAAFLKLSHSAQRILVLAAEQMAKGGS